LLSGNPERSDLPGFPSLINEKRPPAIDTGFDDVSYRVSGAVETVYAALVVQLGLHQPLPQRRPLAKPSAV
jgi:hypothetical protein